MKILWSMTGSVFFKKLIIVGSYLRSRNFNASRRQISCHTSISGGTYFRNTCGAGALNLRVYVRLKVSANLSL